MYRGEDGVDKVLECLETELECIRKKLNFGELAVTKRNYSKTRDTVISVDLSSALIGFEIIVISSDNSVEQRITNATWVKSLLDEHQWSYTIYIIT